MALALPVTVDVVLVAPAVFLVAAVVVAVVVLLVNLEHANLVQFSSVVELFVQNQPQHIQSLQTTICGAVREAKTLELCKQS